MVDYVVILDWLFFAVVFYNYELVQHVLQKFISIQKASVIYGISQFLIAQSIVKEIIIVETI
jgi:hypothetical protein